MIRRTVKIPAAPEQVWEVLTDPQRIPGWFGGEMEWAVERGSPLTFRGNDGETRHGHVREVRPARHLRFEWWPASDPDTQPAQDGPPQDGPSEVSYLLEPADGGTLLTVQETPLRPADPQARACSAPGWDDWDSRLAGAWMGLSGENRLRARA